MHEIMLSRNFIVYKPTILLNYPNVFPIYCLQFEWRIMGRCIFCYCQSKIPRENSLVLCSFVVIASSIYQTDNNKTVLDKYVISLRLFLYLHRCYGLLLNKNWYCSSKPPEKDFLQIQKKYFLYNFFCIQNLNIFCHFPQCVNIDWGSKLRFVVPCYETQTC